jgi:hypothetical protein
LVNLLIHAQVKRELSSVHEARIVPALYSDIAFPRTNLHGNPMVLGRSESANILSK